MAKQNPAVKLLVKPNGQLIPPEGLEETVGLPDWSCRFDRPASFDFAALLAQASYAFGVEVPLSPEQVGVRIKELWDKLTAMSELAGIEQNLILPCILPPIQPGRNLVNYFVPAVGRSYLRVFEGREFLTNNKMIGCVQPTPGTGHERFLSPSADWSLFLCILDCMKSWPVLTQRQPPKELVDLGLSITGGYDGFAMLAEYPQLLMSRYTNPGIDFSGVQLSSGAKAIYVEFDDDYVKIDATDNLGQDYECYSGALSFRG